MNKKLFILIIILILLIITMASFSFIKKDKSNKTILSESEIDQMLTSNSIESKKQVVDYIINNPDLVNPIYYAYVSKSLFENGNLEQGAFWFYLFQIRTRPWVTKDPVQSGMPALRSSLNSMLSETINQWIFSDINSMKSLVARVISYEKKIPLYNKKPNHISTDEVWQKIVSEEREKYEKEFNDAIAEILKDNGKNFENTRKENGLYVGPWQDPGEPLPDNWK